MDFVNININVTFTRKFLARYAQQQSKVFSDHRQISLDFSPSFR